MSNKRIIYCQRVVEAISFLILVLLFIALYVCENTGVSVKRGFFCDDRSIRFPYKDGTVPTFTLVIISVLLPAIIIICGNILENYSQYKKWKWTKYILVTLTYLKFCFMGLLITIIVTSCGKIIAGRLRPHFIDVCKPNFTAFDCTDEMGHPIYVNNYACFGDPGKIHDARLSWPSGHSSITAYTSTFIGLYISRVKVWPPRTIFRMLLVLISLMVAFTVGLSRVSDNKHHPTDVLSGWVIGIVVAIITVYYNLYVEIKKKSQSSKEVYSPTDESNHTQPIDTVTP